MRYVHRETPRVLEDVTNAAMVLYLEHLPGLSNAQYVITNPRNNYPATLNGVGAFEDAIHDYDAIELTVDKRFSNGWALLASYRWSRLWGTYEGFYYNGLDQAKPGETKFDDYPTDDPSYTEVGVPSTASRATSGISAGSVPGRSPTTGRTRSRCTRRTRCRSASTSASDSRRSQASRSPR